MWRRIKALVSTLLDSILPRKERGVRLESYALEDLPVSPEVHDSLGVHITTLMSYRHKAVEDMVRALKYDHSHRAADLLSAVLADYLREEIARIHAISVFPVLLVPVPLHPNRQRARGFNQIETVLDALPQEFQDGTLSRIAHVLSRTRDTSPQTRLARSERLHNVEGAFQLDHESLVRNTHIILIDDVTTTGSTLKEASRPLEAHAASVVRLALAHA